MNDIKLRKGRSLSAALTILTDEGEAYVPASGDTVRFAVCSDRDGTTVISKTLEYDSENEVWALELEPSDTSSLDAGTYHYDIGMQFSAGGYADVIELTDFVILPSASQFVSS